MSFIKLQGVANYASEYIINFLQGATRASFELKEPSSYFLIEWWHWKCKATIGRVSHVENLHGGDLSGFQFQILARYEARHEALPLRLPGSIVWNKFWTSEFDLK